MLAQTVAVFRTFLKEYLFLMHGKLAFYVFSNHFVGCPKGRLLKHRVKPQMNLVGILQNQVYFFIKWRMSGLWIVLKYLIFSTSSSLVIVFILPNFIRVTIFSNSLKNKLVTDLHSCSFTLVHNLMLFWGNIKFSE